MLPWAAVAVEPAAGWGGPDPLAREMSEICTPDGGEDRARVDVAALGMPADCGGVGVGTTVGSGHLAAAGAARAPSKVSADCASSNGPFVGSAKNIVF